MKKQIKTVDFDPFKDGELFISVPTTDSQKEIWSSIEIDPDANLCYNESIKIKLEGNLNTDVLEKALNEVIKKHDALRGTFSPRGKDFLVSHFVMRELPFEDLSNLDEEKLDRKIHNLINEATRYRFDLIHGPLFKFELYKVKENHHILFLTAHHLICDGWSISVIVNEVSKFYDILKKGELITDDLPKQLYEYALEHKEQVLDPYWIDEFKTIPKVLDLPNDLPRPEFRRYESHRIDFQIDPLVIREAQKQAAKNRKSFYQYLLTAFDVLIYNLSKNDDFIIGISSAAQSASGLNGLVGHLVNLLPIRANIRPDMTYKDLLDQTKTKMLDAFDHQNSTFGQILNSLKLERDPSRIPLVNIIFNVDQQYPGQGFEFENIKAEYDSNPRHFENFEIFINATTLADKCVVECQYNIHLFKEETITNWLQSLEQILVHFNQNINAQISSFNSSHLLRPIAIVSNSIEKINKKVVSPENLALTKKIWEETLGISGIPDNANFFSIGGHSLLGVDICHKVQENIGFKITLKDIIKNPTLEDFASLLPTNEINPQSLNIVKAGMAKEKKESTLTMNQMQTWYLEQMNPGTSMHNLPSAIRIKKHVDIKKLETAFFTLIENHLALRTSFQKGPIQKIETMDKVRSIFKLDFEKLDEKSIIKEMNKMGTEAYDLTQAPLIKAKLYEVNKDEFILFTMFHHIIFDGWCFDIFFQELTDAYEGKKIEAEEITYFDYASWQEEYLKSVSFEDDLSFWKEKLKGELPVLDFPLDHQRPPLINHAGGTFPFLIEPVLVDKLRLYCESTRISLFTLFLGTYKKALMDYSQNSEVIVGIPVRGRNSSALLNTIGYFVNVTPVKTKLKNNIKDFFETVQDEVGDSLAHQDAPFEKIMQGLKIKRDPSRTGIFQAFFSYQDVDNRVGMFDGLHYTQVNVEKASTHTDIDIWIKASHKKLEGAIEYRLDLFENISIDRFFRYFHDLLEFIGNSTDVWSDFTSISLSEIIKQNNNTYTKNLPTKTIVDYVDEFAQTSSKADAVISGRERVSYAELKQKSDSIACDLIAKGVKQGDLVGLSSKRDANMLVCLLGIMKAGAGYVPLDPYFPSDRLDYMIEHSKLNHLICNSEFESRFLKHSVKIFKIEDIDWSLTLEKKVQIEQEQTIYVIYTSGSTGLPKGVNLSYRSVLNFLESIKKEPGINKGDRLLAVTTLSFDIAVLELYVPLISGATVVIASKEDTIDGDALKNIIHNENVNIMQATPSTWRLLLSSDWKGSKGFKLLCGGEPFPKDLASQLITMVGEVWNMYGPTETTVWSTIKRITDTDGAILIGSPINNTSVYVLDEKKQPVPFGSVGELYIGGNALALGYIFQDDLTQERFIPDPFRGKGNMYQTGDLVRFHANSELECLGRNDGQVKVRGYRIELGEIEAVLHRHENTEQAVVMVREDRPGDVRLVGYLKLKNKDIFDQFQLREFLNNKLPVYMLPSNYILMDEFPQTLNGKIDKKCLPALDFGGMSKAQENESELKKIGTDALEQRFAKVWLDVLGLNDYKQSDNFFDVGGHSLLSVDLFSKITKEFNVELTLASLITHNTFESILDQIKVNMGVSKNNSIQPTETLEELTIPNLCNSLVAIKASGTKIPIFMFHGVGGNVLNYMRLAPVCGDHPLIGVQAQGVDGHSLPLKSIPAMVTKYIDEIRLVQPHGPYILSGASMGGLIALEVAKKLKQLGQEIDGLVLLDTFGPDINIKNYSTKDNWFAAKWEGLKWKTKRFLVRLKTAFLTMTGRPIPHAIRYFNIEVLNYQAIWSHKVSEYQGDIQIIRAPISEDGWYSDPCMGWKRSIKGDILTHIIDGDHENFVESKDLPKVFKNVLHNL